MSSEKIFNRLATKNNQCDLAFIPIINLDKREKEYFNSFMPQAKTAIVIYYPMINPDDYIWYCPGGKIENERCNIDDWSNEICIKFNRN